MKAFFALFVVVPLFLVVGSGKISVVASRFPFAVIRSRTRTLAARLDGDGMSSGEPGQR
jgi:hypothetical protein